MSEQEPGGTAVPEIEVRKGSGLSIVWLIPLVAAVVAAWLAFTTWSEAGPTITISFKTAVGLEAEKTKIKYKDVEFGLVEDVRVTDDLSRIVVTASLDRQAEPHLNENTRFWVVRPRLGAGGVSGLDTLVSGAYIEIDPGGGEPQRDFVGLEEPPIVRSDVPGRAFLLVADKLGSLGAGSPVYFRGLDVGEVFGYELAEDQRSMLVNVFVRAPYDELVRDNSRFWHASGFDISVDPDGVTVNTESLQTILAGGIAFETPPSPNAEPAADGTTFTLYNSQESVRQLQFTEKVPFVTRFEGSVRGLQPGAPVEFRGIRIGTVTDIRADFDPQAGEFHIPVTFEIEPGRLGQDQLNRGDDSYASAERLVERGLRTQLASGNILTGQLFVALEFFPNAEPATMDFSGPYPMIPSVPSTVDQLKRSVEGILAELSSLQLPELIADARQTLQGLNRLVASPDAVQAITSLESTLKQTESLVRKLDDSVGPLMASLTAASKAAEGTMESADGLVAADSQIVYSLNELLVELTEAARSIRVLADYLEAHPEALVQGKGGNQ